MKFSSLHTLKRAIFSLIIIGSLLLAKEYSDNLGNSYSTEKSKSIDAIEFIQVRGESVPLMAELNSNQAITLLQSKTFMQLVDRDNDWVFVRVPDPNEGYVEGWIRDNKIKKEKDGSFSIFYGKPLLLMEDIIQKRPAWVVCDSTALLTLPKINAKNQGDIFFSTKIFIQQEITDYYQVKVFDEYERKYFDGWVIKKDLTENEKVLSGQDEPVATTTSEPDLSVNNAKILEIKARLEALEKQKKDKEAADLIASSNSKEVQFKALKIKNFKDDVNLLNTSIDDYRKEISVENQIISTYEQENKNSLTAISDFENQISELKNQKIESLKQKELEEQAAKTRAIEEKQQHDLLLSKQTTLKLLTSDLASTELAIANSSKEIETLTKQIAALNDQNIEQQAKLSQESAALTEVQQQLTNKKIAQQQEIENKQAAKAELEKKLIDFKEQKAELQNELIAKNKEIEYYSNEKKSLDTDNSTLMSIYQSTRKTLDESQTLLAQLEEQKGKKEQETANLATKNNNLIAQLQIDLDNRIAQIQQTQTEQEQLNTELSKLKSENENLKSSLNDFNNKINDLKTQKLASIAEATNRQKEQEKLRIEHIEQLKANLLELQNNQSAINKEINDLKNKNVQQLTENGLGDKKKIELNSQLAKLNTALVETTRKKEAADKITAQKTAAEQEKIKIANAKITAQNLKLEQLKVDLEKLNDQISAVKTEIKNEKSNRAPLDNAITDKNRQISDMNIIINTLKAQQAGNQQEQIKIQNKQKIELIVIKESLKIMSDELTSNKQQLLSEQNAAKILQNKMLELNNQLKSTETKLSALKNKRIESFAAKETKDSDRKKVVMQGQLKELKDRLTNINDQIGLAKEESRDLILQNKKLATVLLDKNHDLELTLASTTKTKPAKVSADKEQDALKAQLAELEQAQANLNSTGKEPIANKSRRRGGFKRNNDEEQNSDSNPTNNWNRDSYNISILVSDKKVGITNLYKKYKTQDNLLNGQFILKFDLGADGKTKKVRITDATWSNQQIGNELNKEIEKKVREWKFPPDNHPDISLRQDRPIEIPYLF